MEQREEENKEDKVPRECCTYLEYYECALRARVFEQCANAQRREHCYEANI